MPLPAADAAQSARSSTSTIALYASRSNPQVPPELQSLVSSLEESTTEARDNANSIGSFRIQCEDLSRIRQLLVEDGDRGVIKNAFRHIGGFPAVLGVLQSSNGYLNDASRLSRDEKTEFFYLIKSALDVISEALQAHSGNRSYFVSIGGWTEIEKSLFDTGLGSSHGEDQADTGEEALEVLFGILFAFAIGEESTKGIFRGIQKVSDRAEWETGPSAYKQKPELTGKSPQITMSGDWALGEHIRSQLSGMEVFQNAEIVPTMLNFWSSAFTQNENNGHSSALILGVLMALRSIQTSSERNEVALHNVHALRPLLQVYATGLTSPNVEAVLLSMIERLLDYGLNNLEDAHLLFSKATDNEEMSSLVLHGLQASKSPPFIQFDLSLHGYSSIDLPAMGRPFPPLSSSNGYTIMSWVRFDSFDARTHTTIFGASDATETCFVLLFLEKDDRQLVLQTSVKDSSKASVRFRSTSFRENQWYHIAVVHRKPRTTTSSRATLFINGLFVEQLKCQYPSSPPTRNSSAESFASITGSIANFPSVQAFLGTPQSIAVREGRNMTLTKWSTASFHLFSDAISDEMLQVYHALGPRYVGNYQDSLGSFQTYRASSEVHLKNEQLHPAQPDKSELMAALRQHASALVPESKIIISFSPTFTLDSDDQNQVNESQLIKNLPSDAASSLNRTLRTHGTCVIVNSAVTPISEAAITSHGLGFLTGEPVVSVPQALDDACWRLCGSAPVVLKLLDLAKTKDEVIRAVQIIFASLENNWRNSEAIERENAYGVLAGLIREKLGFGSLFGDTGLASNRPLPLPVDLKQREELALELLRMTLAFVGYSEINPENALLINGLAYRFLLVDFDTWRRAPIATQKVYYGQFVHYAAKGKHHKFNAKRLVRMRKFYLAALQSFCICPTSWAPC
jgi:hypothetical protein